MKNEPCFTCYIFIFNMTFTGKKKYKILVNQNSKKKKFQSS